MLKKFNSWILIGLVGFFLFGLYRLFVNNSLYPYALLVFFTLLSIAMYFSLNRISQANTLTYRVFSVLSLFNSILLFADYLFPEVLKLTWNYSFAIVFVLLFYAVLDQLTKMKGKFSKFTFWLTVFTGTLIEFTLLFKLSGDQFHSIVLFTFFFNTLMIVITFISQLKKNRQ